MYKGQLTQGQRANIDFKLDQGLSVRTTAKLLEYPYGQVRGYAEYVDDHTIEPPHSPKMLIFDIENAPFLTWNWGLWDQNAIDVEQDWYMLSFAYAWYNLETDSIGDTDFVSLFQDPTFYRDTSNDNYVVDKLWWLLDEADIVIGQNSKTFDVKKFAARAIIQGMLPPTPFLQIDTKRAASSVANFGSNSLKQLARMLGLSLKEENRGFQLWRDCMRGDADAWAEMESYNRQDVVTTAELYSRLRPWMTAGQHPNLGLFITAKGRVCTVCGNKEKDEGGLGFQKRGYKHTNASRFGQVLCLKCGKYSHDYRREPQNTPERKVNLR